MTSNISPYLPLPPPFNIRASYYIDRYGCKDRIFLEKTIKLRKNPAIEIQNTSLNRNLKKIAKWVEDMKKENPLYEIEDSQLIIRPSDDFNVKPPTIGAKLIMKKIDTKTSQS